jgi:magnesium transporter
MQEEHRNDKLYIDFDYLEDFINSENQDRQACRRPSVRVFPDLRPQSASPEILPSQVVTCDGDILDMPSELSTHDEKEPHDGLAEPVKVNAPQHDPNRFSFFSSAWESTIHAAELGDLVLPGENIRGLFSFPKGETDGVWWLNVNNPTEEEVRAICKAFGVHPLTIEDITTQESREKIELFSAYYFACFRSFNVVVEDGEPDYEPFNLYVIVFREGTLSFSFAPNAHASHVRKRIAMLKDYVALSSDWICYALM